MQAGSKMICDSDHLLSIEEQDKYTKYKRDKHNLVILTEKINGMNTGVIKLGDCLFI